MRTLRRARGVSLLDIQRETRIPEGILEEFERTGLTTNQLFNRVYLRSLVIAYSRFIGIDQQESLSALEAALEGSYDGRLLGESTPEPALEPAGDHSSDTEDATQELQSPDRFIEEGDGDAIARAETEATGTSEEGDPSTEEAQLGHHFEFVFTDTANGSSPHGAGRDSSTDRIRTEISTAIHDFRPPEDQRGLIVHPSRFRAVALGSLAVVVSVSAIIMAARLSERTGVDTSPPEDHSPAMIQRLEEATLPPEPPPLDPAVILGDTITVTITAAKGPLDPIRVQLDRDLRRPYWIDVGQSADFSMSQRIVIQDLLERLEVSVEGLPYPIDSYRDLDRVVITRDSIEAFVESTQSR